MFTALAFVLTLLTSRVVLTSASTPYNHIVHERREVDTATEWVKRSRLDEGLSIPVSIGLTQTRLEHGHNRLMDISDPRSPNYGRHYTPDQVSRIFAPAEVSVRAVRAWLELYAGGIFSNRISLSANKQWLRFNASTVELEGLLHTTYHHFEHATSDRIGLACEKYLLPKEVQMHVDFITPGIAITEYIAKPSLSKRQRSTRPRQPHHVLTLPSKELASKLIGKTCVDRITPECVKQFYNITDTVQSHPGPALGIYESEETYQQPFLDAYFENVAPCIPNGTRPDFDRIDGAPPLSYSKKQSPSEEANLDFEVAYPFLYPNRLVNYQVDDKPVEFDRQHYVIGLFNTFLDALDASYCNYTAYGITGDTTRHSRFTYDGPTHLRIDPLYPDPAKGGYKHPEQCGKYKPAPVISTSYIIGEVSLPVNYQRRQCNEFMKLGLMGVTVINASGDHGVGQNYAYTKTQCLGKDSRKFGPNYPVNCPYVTAVGGTKLVKGQKEAAWLERHRHYPTLSSGGGFSNIYPRPQYQDAAVGQYFSEHPPSYPSYNTSLHRSVGHHSALQGRFNRAGRGYPDVSAFGYKYLTYTFRTDQPDLSSGTSVAAPLFAALVARINAARIAAGKSTVGFINPVMYANPHVFNDIISGHNPACHSNGFNATKGWDPVTGLGSPNYGLLKELFMSLP